MSKIQDSMTLDVEPTVAEDACRQAVAQLGWRLLEDGAQRLVTKEVMSRSTQMTWPAKVEIIIRGDGQGSEIGLRGSITGVGPLQKNHLKGQIGAMKNHITLAVRDRGGSAVANEPAGLSSELERLAQLRVSGALTPEEFADAKARLLAS